MDGGAQAQSDAVASEMAVRCDECFTTATA